MRNLTTRCIRGFGGWATGAGWATALALALSMSMSGQVMAQSPGPPMPNEVWAGCELGEATTAVETALSESPGNVQPNVSFIVVYTLDPNDGQEIGVEPGSNEFTGPVICINEAAVDINSQAQHARVPAEGTVTTLDAEEAFALRYQLTGGGIEKVFCHSVDNEVFCYRISPVTPPVEVD